MHDTLEAVIEHWFAQGPAAIDSKEAAQAFHELCDRLERGELRAAEPDPSTPTGWRVNPWVKRGILLGFRIGNLVPSDAGPLHFVDKHTYPTRRCTP